jgi:hypothetical protein
MRERRESEKGRRRTPADAPVRIDEATITGRSLNEQGLRLAGAGNFALFRSRMSAENAIRARLVFDETNDLSPKFGLQKQLVQRLDDTLLSLHGLRWRGEVS